MQLFQLNQGQYSLLLSYLFGSHLNTVHSNAILYIYGVFKARQFLCKTVVCPVEILEARHTHLSMPVLLSVPALIYSRPT